MRAHRLALCFVVPLAVLTLAVSAHAALVGSGPELTVIDSAPPELGLDTSEGIEPDFLGATVTLSGVPDALWWYGCSATSAGMLFGYYDQYTGPGGAYTNMYNGTITGDIDTVAERNLIATNSHITDYWIAYGSAGPDPWVGNWAEHTWADSTADYMGTNQWKWDNDGGGIDYNTDGSTTYWSYGSTSNLPLYDHIQPAGYGLPQTSLCHGLRLFTESRGYTVAYEGGNYQDYNQSTDNVVTGGFSFADYMTEIDALRPVLLHVTGHTMLGYGYNTDGSKVILHDTWTTGYHDMTWGGAYSGRDMLAVTVLKLNMVPEPGTLALMGFGLLGLAVARRRKREA